jgi:hypothetical protein
MGDLPSREDDEQLVRDLNEDAEEIERTRDPMELGHDPQAGEAVSQMADKRTRS